MRKLLIVFILALPMPSFGQFLDEENRTSSDQLAFPKPVQLQVGIVIRATASPLKGVQGSTPIPIEWPEQQVKVIEEKSSPHVRRISYEMVGDTVKRMVVHIPFVRPGDTAEAIVTFECTRYHIMAPGETEKLTIPKRKQIPPAFRKYLGPSPYIETKHSKIRKLAKSIVQEKEGAWNQVEAMYDWVRNNITYKNGPIKGAYEALKDGEGDCEEMSSLFIALCRVNGIPARTVWIPGHCYPEFYLMDESGEGKWFPCQVAGTRAFGSMPEYRPILQKGDNFKMPEKKGRQRYVSEQLKVADIPGGNEPKIEFVREILAD